MQWNYCYFFYLSKEESKKLMKDKELRKWCKIQEENVLNAINSSLEKKASKKINKSKNLYVSSNIR